MNTEGHRIVHYIVTGSYRAEYRSNYQSALTAHPIQRIDIPIVSLSSSGISRNPKCVVRDFRVSVEASGISERGAEEVDPKGVVELDEVEEEACRNAC
jgi:hypothetical protein